MRALLAMIVACKATSGIPQGPRPSPPRTVSPPPAVPPPRDPDCDPTATDSPRFRFECDVLDGDLVDPGGIVDWDPQAARAIDDSFSASGRR
jgi:hypothetical protein